MRRDDTLVVRADLPGLTPDENKIEVEDGALTVSGQHQEDRSDSDGGRMSAVSVASAPSRGRSPAVRVDAQAIKAQTHDGVVEVTVLLPRGATTQKVEITPEPASDEG